MVMADSKGLETAFPKFADDKKVSAFKQGLARIKAGLSKERRPINFLQASSFIDDVTELNEKTLDLPEPVLVYEMTDGATSKLDDFTSLIWPHDLEQFTIIQMNIGREVSRRLRKADDLLFQVQMQTSTQDPSYRFYSG